MRKLFTTTLMIALFCAGTIFAQDNKGAGLEEGPLGAQFDYAIQKASSHNEFKVIRLTWLRKLKSNALDSIKVLQESVSALEGQVQEQQKEVNVLKSNLKETNDKLEVATQERDSFRFLGALLTKSVYSTMVWTIIFVLVVALLVMIFLFKRSNSVTVKTKQSLEEKQEEFDKHRKWALEREQTLARELNKLKQKYKGLD